MMSNGLFWSLKIVPTILLTCENTPIPDRIIHSTATMTTPAMPSATEIKNDIFMADHGSTRETVSLTRRARATPAADPVGRVGPPDAERGTAELPVPPGC